MKPKITVVALTAKSGGIDSVSADMLLLTKLAGMKLGPGPLAVDAALNGAITRKLRSTRFRGDIGQSFLLDVEQEGVEDAALDYVYLVGLGSPDSFHPRLASRVFKDAVRQAVKLGARSLAIPFPPKRVISFMSNKCTAYLLRNAVAEICPDDFDGRLRTIKILCSPQAKPHVQRGLSLRGHETSCRGQE